MITPHHNRKQKVCKDIIAYPEEKTNKKHQIPPHKRKGSSRKKNHIRHMSMWYTLCCPPSAFPAPPERCWLFCPGRAHWFACGCIFFAGFPGRFPPPSAAPLICFVTCFRVRFGPLCGSRLFLFWLLFLYGFISLCAPLIFCCRLVLCSPIPFLLTFYFCILILLHFLYFHFFIKKGRGKIK